MSNLEAMEESGRQLLLKLLSPLLTEGRRVLDVGCGNGEVLHELVQHYPIRGVGIDPHLSARGANRLQLVKLKAEKVQELPGLFHLAYTLMSLHHFKDPSTFFSQMFTKLAWKGRLIVVDWKKGVQTGVSERYYSVGEVIELLTKSGLKPINCGEETFHFYAVATPVFRKIAVATKDGRTVYPGMFERSKFFAIYQSDQRGKFMLLEKRSNKLSKTMQHMNTFDVYSIVSDCQALLSKHIEKKDRQLLEDMGVQLFFGAGTINDILERLCVP
ncbi:MAG: methyltransferase domain-containing protein [Deltaproteobacteria bacterium]|nr:methyltransferase domain-containing protein [Deltaproteobacteria bacterium]